jgi:hypothetical protein
MTTAIKKDFVDLIAFLEENKTKKVSTILDELKVMCSKKTNDKTFKVDDAGFVTQVFCYYHKVWEDVDTIEYGPKKNTASGLNTMCKEGVSNWTKQQRVAKKSREELLTKLGSGELTIEELPGAEALIEAERTKIIEHSMA